MEPVSELSPARAAALARSGKWQAAFDAYSAADAAGRVENGADLEDYATSAYMTGREDGFVDLMSRAFDAHCDAKNDLRAVRVAFWAGLTLMFRGEFGRGGGWLARAGKLVEAHGADCAERGYLMLPGVEAHFGAGENDRAESVAAEAAAIGDAFDDVELAAVARHLVGRARLAQGDIAGGLSALDEAMVATIEGRLSPIATGLVYCSVIEACQKYQILRRASEWTGALSDWCARQPELTAFTGRCLIHRSEVLSFDGLWPEAAAEAAKAIERLAGGPAAHQAGPAFYQQGELHRLRGELDAADEAFRAASALGYDPQPGLALMRLQVGRLGPAAASIRRALAAADTPVKRMRLLPAAGEIAIASEDPEAARAFTGEMEDLARRFPSEVAEAVAAEMRGDLALFEGETELSLQCLARAAELWREMRAPYRLCRARMKTARGCARLGDVEGALAEAAAARDGFARLGAAPDRRAAETFQGLVRDGREALLTARQSEVLRLVCKGLTNREIAARLGISERTVDRHVSDILTRLDVPTRTAAAAYAASHGLLAGWPSG